MKSVSLFNEFTAHRNWVFVLFNQFQNQPIYNIPLRIYISERCTLYMYYNKQKVFLFTFFPFRTFAIYCKKSLLVFRFLVKYTNMCEFLKKHCYGIAFQKVNFV